MARVLEGKGALVIGGGGGGIGRAITRALAAAGSNIAVVDIDRQRAEEAAVEAAASGVQAFALTGDVRSRADIDGFVTDAARELGALDILVTVVGGQLAFVPRCPSHEVSDEDWDLIFEVNLHYVARAVRASLRVFLEQGTGGTIVSVGSITAIAGSPMQSGLRCREGGAGEPGPIGRGRVRPRRDSHERRHLRPCRDARGAGSSGGNRP